MSNSPAPDNKPTSLEAILIELEKPSTKPYPGERLKRRKQAIAAITALIPEKDTITDDMTTSVKAWHEGYNDGIDTIHHNFTGQTDNEREQ